MTMRSIIYRVTSLVVCIAAAIVPARSQVNAEQVMVIGQNALYFEDYIISIQYFNQAIQAKPYLAKPYFFRAIAKLNLDDFQGAEADATKALELNPFITDAYEVRGVARQNMGKAREAVEDYRHALELLPNNRQLMFNMAMAEQTAGMPEAADSTFEKLIKAYPGFDNAYIGRARLRMEKGDTTAAEEDINKALELNANSVNGYLMRADIAINRQADYAQALEDMNHAIKLQPKYSGFYVNRAFLRYKTDDYFGAMADFDYALELEPLNTAARFNRGLLLAEVNANDRALEDFSRVLDVKPDDYRARYNRAVIHANKMQWAEAIDDINMVISAFPDFPGALMMRSEFYRKMGKQSEAMADYDRALALSRKKKHGPQSEAEANPSQGKTAEDGAAEEAEETADDVARMFASLLTVQNEAEITEEFNNKDIRGRVQDRNFTIDIEPMMELSYHAAPTELRENTYYIKEVEDINSSRALRQLIVVTNNPPILTHQEDIAEHFTSIEYYTSYIATHPRRAVDYIGRGLDFITIHNYPAAIKDLTEAIEITPDFPMSYFLRAQARHRELQSRQNTAEKTPGTLSGSLSATEMQDAMLAAEVRKQAYEDILADINKTIELSPGMSFAYYNRGNLYVELQDYVSAIDSYTKAIELKNDLGEAYFNRGFTYLKLGNKPLAVNDLSKAGELGVLPAYSLLKRITR